MQEDSSTTGTTTTKKYLKRLVFPSLTRARVKSHVSGKNERRETFASEASILGASSFATGRASALAPTLALAMSNENDSSPPTPSASSASLANKSSSISAVFSSGPNKGNTGFCQT